MNNKFIGMLTLIISASLLAGCNEAERGRPLSHEKGVYQGKQDEQLSDEARQRLRQRMSIQSSGGL